MERVVKVLKENEVATMVRNVVDEFEFPEYISKRLDTGEERVFTYNGLGDDFPALSEYEQAEKYYNYLSYDLYYDRSHSISKW